MRRYPVANTEPVEITKIKKRARSLKRRMDDLGVAISLQQALEAVAAEEGFKTWASLSASLAKAAKGTSGEEEVPEFLLDVGPRLKKGVGEVIRDLALRHHRGQRESLCVLVTGPTAADRSRAVQRLGQHLGLYITVFQNGPLPKYKTMGHRGLRTLESAAKLGSHGTYIEGLKHLLDVEDADCRKEADALLVAMAERIRDLPPGQVVFVGSRDRESLPHVLAGLPFVEVSLAAIEKLRSGSRLDPTPHGLRGSASPALRDKDADERRWRNWTPLPLNGELI